VLPEVAPGVNLRRDVLERIGFPLRVADELRPMDRRLFRPESMNLLPEFRARAGQAARRIT
jgi:propionate CoA-transferase